MDKCSLFISILVTQPDYATDRGRVEKNRFLSLTLLAIFLSITSLFFSLKKKDPSASTPLASPKASDPIQREYQCPSDHYLAGITADHEAVCRPVASIVSSAKAPVETPPNTLFVGGWAVDETCVFKKNSTTTIGDCNVPNFDSIPECSAASRPSVVDLSEDRKVFFPTPCLRHLDSCYVTNNSDDQIQRIYLSCRPYNVFMVEN